MLNSKEQLMSQARAGGYKPEILEKVYRLLDVFQQIMAVPFLQERLVLKGGTALNLFCFEKLPRLSVDIDLNYIGALDREKMLEEKPLIVDAVGQIISQNQFERHRAPMKHAGGKMVWFYPSLLGQRGSLEIDINFMYRQPLFPIGLKSPNIEAYKSLSGPVLDIHELAAGKLSALFDRSASRDWFDAHYLLTQTPIDKNKLKLAFVTYLAMTKIEFSKLVPKQIDYDLTDLHNRLVPVMHQPSVSRNTRELKEWATARISELRQELSSILPLEEHEILFINKIRNEGIISPELITNDLEISQRIRNHPAINWAIKQR
ncbi:TPA: nucleotidyl transferase AbiEii/AbiGii toxin family protein [Legionella pneumophila]|nr:nucleotidyl transferase AbiEii/AbiGii toxin family protein [Legionella pneumophila]HAU1380113.1 nucleotidyl transferase AbiEii/AbiGii toxin family protein [Legionella pneumophila]HAU1525495.1 nucleotidyl transferase AbiEii/AbiGii toxin family protein [Legionella pneumophila]HAU1540771.1 nucleotidyl transferase AbiEii/AbiGii toxin family protein [Legionella pneumophila]HBD7333718.1 nucleotidyl transferase AbiEii/AbiGii toxin family protein [Legionella pneumophila]